jgi:RNA polymerase sigma factor (sigma-70 family)
MQSNGLPDLLGHAGWLRRLAASLVRDPDLADDVVQQTMVAAWTHGPVATVDGEGNGRVRAWLGKIARNQARDQRRGERRRRTREEVAVEIDRQTCAASPATPEQLIGNLEIHRILAEVVTALDEPYRSTLVLHYYEAIPAADIAQRLGIPPSTVRWRVQEALGRVRQALDRRHGGDRDRWRRALAPLIVGPAAQPATHGAGLPAPTPPPGKPSPPSRLTGMVWLGTGAVALLMTAIFYAVGVDAPDAARARGAAPVSPPVRSGVHDGTLAGKRTAPPRFSITGTDQPPADTPDQRQANDILQRMLAAVLADDYEAFLADASDMFKVASTPETWRRVRSNWGNWMSGGFEVQPVGRLRRERHTVFLFKLEFRDGTEDELLQLALEDGRVTGFTR